MIIKVKRRYDGSLYTLYIKEESFQNLEGMSAFVLAMFSEAVLRDDALCKLRPETLESLLDKHFEVS